MINVGPEVLVGYYIIYKVKIKSAVIVVIYNVHEGKICNIKILRRHCNIFFPINNLSILGN